MSQYTAYIEVDEGDAELIDELGETETFSEDGQEFAHREAVQELIEDRLEDLPGTWDAEVILAP